MNPSLAWLEPERLAHVAEGAQDRLEGLGGAEVVEDLARQRRLHVHARRARQLTHFSVLLLLLLLVVSGPQLHHHGPARHRRRHPPVSATSRWESRQSPIYLFLPAA